MYVFILLSNDIYVINLNTVAVFMLSTYTSNNVYVVNLK